MFTIGQVVEVYFEGATPKWKLADIVAYNENGVCVVKLASDGKLVLIRKDDIRTPQYSSDYYRGFTCGFARREYLTAQGDEWQRGYVMGVVARVGAPTRSFRRRRGRGEVFVP